MKKNIILTFFLICITTFIQAQQYDASSPYLEVLDAKWYLLAHPDVEKAAKTVSYSARDFAAKHWLEYGIKEGRQSSPNFSIKAYLNRYPDLQKAFGSDYEAAIRHWFVNGKYEGRNPKP